MFVWMDGRKDSDMWMRMRSVFGVFEGLCVSLCFFLMFTSWFTQEVLVSKRNQRRQEALFLLILSLE